MYNSTPKLTVVGAGPGDADLITLKAVKVLNKAAIKKEKMNLFH